jgi:hypothetical protein
LLNGTLSLALSHKLNSKMGYQIGHDTDQNTLHQGEFVIEREKKKKREYSDQNLHPNASCVEIEPPSEVCNWRPVCFRELICLSSN